MQGNVYKKNETFNVDEAVLKAQVQASQQAAESAKEAAQRAADLIGENINFEEIRKELEGKLNVDGSNSDGVIPIEVSSSERAEKDITGNDITSYVYNVVFEDGILYVIKGDKSLNQVQVSLIVDDALSETSENPVQNKVVTENLNPLISSIWALNPHDRKNVYNLLFANRKTPSTVVTDIKNNAINFVSAEYVEDAIGDIETALENIISKYGLGGDSV